MSHRRSALAPTRATPEAPRSPVAGVVPGSAGNSTDERILDATLVVLARSGRQLSMSAVAQAAGVSRMTLYRHHASKDDLLLALARHQQHRFDERLAASLSGVTDPAARVDAVLIAIVSFLEGSAARVAVEAEPGFIIERMRRSLPVQRATIERLIGDALREVPAVRAGHATPSDIAEMILRVAMSDFLVPAPDATTPGAPNADPPNREFSHQPGGAALRALRALVRPIEGAS